MAPLKKTTRVKRDLPDFRNKLRQFIEDGQHTQVKIAEQLGMDVRTFNHIIAGPTHPDLQFFKDVGQKLKLNLNWLFGLSDNMTLPKGGKSYNLDNYDIVPFWEVYEGSPWMTSKEGEANMEPLIVPHKNFSWEKAFYALHIVDSECDRLQGTNVLGYFREANNTFTKKGIYNIGVDGRSYMRWIDKPLGSDKLRLSKDVLMKDVVEMDEKDVIIQGLLYRVAWDFSERY